MSKRNIAIVVVVLVVVVLVVAGISITFLSSNLQGLIFKSKPTIIDTNKFRDISSISQKNLDAIKKVQRATTYCNRKNFKIGFILLYENKDQLTNERLDILKNMKNDLSQSFLYATKNLATMDTLDDIYLMPMENSWYFEDDDGKDIFFHLISKKFYETHYDIYDFLVLARTFDLNNVSETKANAYLLFSKNDISGIGIDIFDNDEKYGSKGKLLGSVVLNKDIKKYIIPPGEEIPSLILLHEIGHRWCCNVGDTFQNEANNAKLEIKTLANHFYPGLESGHEIATPMGGAHWVSNGDGTFKMVVSKEGIKPKYHDFFLYFMGLLPKSEYSKKFPIYAFGWETNNWNETKATLYKEISVDDIIAVEGNRQCN
ncbi:hypothetical protein HZA39_03260 [Candidatus Peregrinibacteria bacterium]|nr:hypothetical protein [Candidatus Peregrinibacteria bacterium]